MNIYLLQEVVKELQKFQKIRDIYRISDNVINIDFDRASYSFDLTKSNSLIYPSDKNIITKKYKAPFDIVLSKRFRNSLINSIEIVNSDRIISINSSYQNSYKIETTSLQLEFTGKYTNAIILENRVVIEALRHIEESVRVVRIGEILKPIPEYNINDTKIEIDDINSYLNNLYQMKEAKLLLNVKNSKILSIDKKLTKLYNIYNDLEDRDIIITKANKQNSIANVLLANLHNLKLYQDSVTLRDFDDNEIKIELPKVKAVNLIPEFYFKSSKKLKQKAIQIDIQKENVKTKIDFLEKLKIIIRESKDKSEINILYPKQEKITKEIENSSCYKFVIDGFIIIIGKNENGNIELLKLAKGDDIWMHIQGVPSAHIIIKRDKKNVPEYILNYCAKLCAKFSLLEGNYFVDYTHRRNVKPQKGSNVTYTNYKTISIKL